MNRDYEYIVFPCQRPGWTQVRDLLDDLKDTAQRDSCDLQTLAIFHQRIVDINAGFDNPEDSCFGETSFYGLVKFLRKYATKEEKHLFLQSTLPVIIDLVLELPCLLPPEGLTVCSQQREFDVELGRLFVASVLASAFLCLFDERGKPWETGDRLNVINFTKFFKNLPSPSQNAKIRCILNYFERVAERNFSLNGNIRFIRQVIPLDEMPTLDTWLHCDSELCPFVVHHEGKIEDSVPEAIEVDFANRYIGGGVIGRGRVQEEIRFTVCPELMSAMLFMEAMDDNEAIIIQGYEQFSETEGYGPSLTYAGDFKDKELYDNYGNHQNTLCAIDAVSYRRGADKQYTDHNCIRDLNKAYIGFSANLTKQSPHFQRSDRILDTDQEKVRSHSSSNCDSRSSVSDEEYHTAGEENENNFSELPQIINYVEALTVDIMSLALMKASNILCKTTPKNKTTSSSEDDNSANSSFDSKQSSEDNAVCDHVDMDFQDWVSRFRRRSSNLSDLGSRRSSGSTRYSSDFSSEFEEYYENFQRREQNVIHNTITEEEFCPLISDFASNLALKLLQESTALAARNNSNNIKQFYDGVADKTLAKPKARKPSDEDSSSIVITETVAKKFADIFIHRILPVFDDQSSSSSSAVPLKDNLNIPTSAPTSPNSSVKRNISYSHDNPEAFESDTFLLMNGNGDADDFIDETDLRIAAVNLVDLAISSAVQIVQEDLDFPMIRDSKSYRCGNRTPDSSVKDDDNLTVISRNGTKKIDQSSSPSKSPKNVQFSDSVSQTFDHEDFKELCARTLSESSLSQDSFTIPTLLVTSEQRGNSDVMYDKIAEKIIMSGFSNALKDVQNETGESFEGASLTFSATASVPEHSLHVQGNNLIYPGEILRGDSYEDVQDSQDMSCFASSLSRDLLTNAFVEVQRNTNGANYARRSSEPMKISNQAARQLLEDTKNGIHRYSEKSKSCTEDDLRDFARELDRRWLLKDFSDRRGPCGFKDPTLSKFAEELMKTKCKVPTLQIPDSTTCSISGSSTSFHSSKSGFRDPMLSSFEEELLSASFRKSSTRGSIKRKAKKVWVTSKPSSALETENNSSTEGNKTQSSVSPSTIPSSSSSQEHMADYAERLANKILFESFQTAFRDTFLLPNRQDLDTVRKRDPDVFQVSVYADSLALDIIHSSLLFVVKVIGSVKDSIGDDFNSCIKNETSAIPSDHFCDALNMPYIKLEEFAESVAEKVISSSVGLICREMDCFKKKETGRPIATGNWGCGAFRGDVHLKSMLQWMAASYAGVPAVLYYSFHHPDLVHLEDVVSSIRSRQWSVGQLMQAVRTYCVTCQDLDQKPDLFQLLMDQEAFADI